MKRHIKIISAVLLTAALSACGGNVPGVSETTSTAFENHTIMPKVAEEEEETETELPATDFDGVLYEDEDYETRENDEYRYDVYKDRIVLTKYLGESAVVEIPAEIDGLKVTEIGVWAFALCDELKSVTLPNGIEKIGWWAFGTCTSLTKIEIPDSVAEIGEKAFDYCINLVEISIPESVTKIESEAFKECYKLKNVTIPDNFDNDVLKEAFGDTYWYRKLCDETYVEFRQNEEYGYYVYENHIILSKYQGDEGQLDIPAEIDGISVTEIDDNIFAFEGITSVTIPNSITKIGTDAFAYNHLTEVTIPKSVTFLGEYAFSNCENLTDVTVPEYFDDETIKAAFKYTPWYEENYGE